jgi:hypothetical protein
MSIFSATIPVQHQVWTDNGTRDSHNKPIHSLAPPVTRMVEAIYPLHMRPRRDPVTVEYEARTETDLLMSVPDATIYSKNDRVLIKGKAFLVQNDPRNWGGDDPFGFDKTMFGGQIHLKRIT